MYCVRRRITDDVTELHASLNKGIIVFVFLNQTRMTMKMNRENEKGKSKSGNLAAGSSSPRLSVQNRKRKIGETRSTRRSEAIWTGKNVESWTSNAS